MRPLGMVDALRQAHRALRPGGALLDVRPDAERPPRIRRGGRTLGKLVATDLTADRAADHAAERAVADGLFRRERGGHFWFALTFPSVAALDRWVATNRRFRSYEPGLRERLRRARGPIRVRRAIAFDEYVRLGPARARRSARRDLSERLIQ